MSNKFFSTFTMLLTALMSISSAQAQVPRTISYQGVLTDASGTFISDGNHKLTLTLYDALNGSTQVFSETQSVAVVRGIFNVILGSVSPIPTSLSFNRAYFLGVSVDDGAELSPRTPLTAVPYALRASVATVAESLTPDATGVVTKLNGQSGTIDLVGGGSTSINRSGNTIMISS